MAVTSPTRFPLDIKSAKEFGLKKWREEYSWPVSYESHMRMESEIKGALNEVIAENHGNGASELVLVNYKLFLEYGAFLYALRVLNKVRENGAVPLCSHTSINFKGILEKGIPLNRLLPVPSLQSHGLKGRLRGKWISTKVHLSLGGSWTRLLKRPFISPYFIGNCFSLNGLPYEYIRNRLNGCVKLTHPGDWYSRAKEVVPPGEAQRDEISRLCQGLVLRMEKIGTRYGLALTELQHNYLVEITMELLLSTRACLDVLKKNVSALKPLHMLAGCGGAHFTRMLSVAIRDNGGTVTGFKHGEPLIHSWDYYSWMELSTVDRFITYTEHSAEAIKNARKKYPPPGGAQAEIEGMDSRVFYDLWKKERKKAVPRKIKRVMLVGKGLENDNHIGQGIGMPELMQLDLETRIIHILKKSGYEVLYKVHPFGMLSEEAKDLYEDHVRVVYEPFEDVLDLADAFIFYFTITSTFGKALCTGKPVVYVNGGWEPWFPEVYHSFSKRCGTVSARFDEGNRLIINVEELLEALAVNTGKSCMDFLEKYMFPSRR